MKRPVLFVALAGLAAMLASVVVFSALRKRDAAVRAAMAKTVHIVVAAYDLPLGDKIDAGQLKLARWSAEDIPTGAFTDPNQVVGAFVKSQFVANEPIVATKLFMGQKTAGIMPLLIPAGMRAVSVPVDEVSDIAGFVLPHTHVDVVVSITGQGQGPNQKPFSKIVLQDIEVLAVAQEVEQNKDKPQLVRVVTMLVTPEQAERLALASREGTLRLAMRNYNDNKIVLTSGTDIPEMLHAYAAPSVPLMTAQAHHAHVAPVRRVPKVQVEIFRNGKSSELVSFVNEASAEPLRPSTAYEARRAFARPLAAHEPNLAANAGTDKVARDTRSAAPAAGSESSGSGSTVEPAAYVPTPKTIDVP
jgi:pilus assembly protein CpaB